LPLPLPFPLPLPLGGGGESCSDSEGMSKFRSPSLSKNEDLRPVGMSGGRAFLSYIKG
jgi:hypothetical protein